MRNPSPRQSPGSLSAIHKSSCSRSYAPGLLPGLITRPPVLTHRSALRDRKLTAERPRHARRREPAGSLSKVQGVIPFESVEAPSLLYRGRRSARNPPRANRSDRRNTADKNELSPGSMSDTRLPSKQAAPAHYSTTRRRNDTHGTARVRVSLMYRLQGFAPDVIAYMMGTDPAQSIESPCVSVRQSQAQASPGTSGKRQPGRRPGVVRGRSQACPAQS